MRKLNPLLFAAALIALTSAHIIAEESAKTVTKTQSFDTDPNWEAFNNRIVPKEYRTIAQNFGFSQSNFAGKAPGEMGGRVWRAAKPAFYADRIETKTLDDRLTASGSFAIKKSTPGSGIFFGFFRGDQPGGGGRPVCSLGLDMDGEHSGARLAVRLITAKNQSCGTFITPFIPGKFRPTPIRNDGTRYNWKLDYDPDGAGGRGRFTFEFTSDAHKLGELEAAELPEKSLDEARRRFPSTTTFSVDLPEGYKQQGTEFDHFGLMGMMKPGGEMQIYFDDLKYLDRSQDFSSDPNWQESGSRETYQESDALGAHNFGFSNTANTGGKIGELGGTFWRAGKYAYYADRVGPLSLENRLEAKGKVVLKVGAPDSDMYLGWFSSRNKDKSADEPGQFVGVHIGGPTRVGHYFIPMVVLAKDVRGKVDSGPVLQPNKVYDWTFVYDPDGADGRGAIRVTLGSESVTLDLRKGVKAEGASLDRFGVFTSTIGGQLVKVYLDDLTYTSASPGR
jgi:hypothetical protein